MRAINNNTAPSRPSRQTKARTNTIKSVAAINSISTAHIHARVRPARHLRTCMPIATISTEKPTTPPTAPPGRLQSYVPLIGETPAYLSDPVKFMTDRYAQYGPVFRSHLFGQPVYIVAPLEGWRETTQRLEFESIKMWFPKSFRLLLGDPQGQVDTAASHLTMRRNMATAFSPDAMAQYLPRIETRIQRYLQQWSGEEYQVQGMDVQPQLEELTFGFAAELIVGLEVDAATEKQLVQLYTTFSNGLFSLPLKYPGSPLYKAQEARDELIAIIAANIKTVRDNMQVIDASGRHNVLYYNLQTFPTDSIEEQVNRVLQFILAGHDTTRSTFCAMILLLTELPHVIDKLRQEQDTIVNTHGETLNMDALTDMKYADAVIREVLRLLGPSRGVWRRAMHDVPLFGKVVPAGSLMFISTDGAHALDPAVMGGENFDHMDVYNLEASFKPERWLEAANLPPEQRPTLTSFGSGMHLCLGMPLFFLEAKALLALLVRGYDMQRLAPDRVQWAMVPFPLPTQPATVRIQRRV